MCESKVVVMPIETQRETFQMIFSECVTNTEGRLLTLIETTGLQGVQLTALKSLARQELWTMYDEIWRSIGSYKILEEPISLPPTKKGIGDIV